MNHIYKIALLLLFSFAALCSYAADRQDTARMDIEGINRAFNSGKLPEQKFLDSMHTYITSLTAQGISIKNKELLVLLNNFKKVAWSKPAFAGHKRNYYVLLAEQSHMAGRNGEMLYYAEKIAQLEQAKTNKPSLTGATFEIGYYNDMNSFEKSREVFLKARPQMIALLNNIDKVSDADLTLGQLTILLCHSAKTAYKLTDTIMGAEVEQYLDRVDQAITRLYPDSDKLKSHFKMYRTLALNDKAIASVNSQLRQSVFGTLENMLQDKKTPAYLKDYISFNIVNEKVPYFLKYKQNDSALYYLTQLREMRKDDGSAYNKYVMGQFKAKYLYNTSKYQESADTLGNSIAYLDTTYSDLVKDINEMMYAQAKAEEQQVMLDEATAENKRKEKMIWAFAFGGILLATLSAGIIIIIRQRQKRKFLEFKLNMARNIHDETGPALLYAKSLAKSCKVIGDDEHMRAELEKHIENTMAVIRSLSHDLKSDALHSIDQLIKETEVTLNKLKGLNLFNFEIKRQLEKNRFISHYQFSQLKSVLQECITNSIKHAAFDRIELSFTESGNKLTISYHDNGSGWDNTKIAGGIGLENMKERVRLVNGDFKIDRRLTESYQIQIIVPLR